jgi:RNA polymerase sigma factor (sigma-70 family)
MRDSEVVASITAGDPLGLAEAYDRYSGPLFGYCQTLLDEPADAADAVQDTFVIAASKLSTLRDPERLRAWLFAVARNECLHRLKSRRVTTPLAIADDRPDENADVSDRAERAEARELIRAAVGGLNAGERDVINQLWHGLSLPEVAAVLGVSRNHVYSLFSRARDQLEASLGVLLVGRAGRKDCAALDRLLAGWDGRLTAPLRKRVGRHIDRCPVCSDRRQQVLTPALLFDLTPAAVLALAVVRQAGPAVAHLAPAAHLAVPPAALRGDVLRLATDRAPHAAAYRAEVARSTGPFHGNGFPKAAHTGHLALSRAGHLPLALAGGTAATATVTVAVTATAVVTAIVPNVHLPAITGGGSGSAPAHAPSAVPSTAPGTRPAVMPAYRLTASAVAGPSAGKAKHHGRKAKRMGFPDGGRPAGSGGDGSGYGHGNWNGRGNGNGQGNWNGNGNGQGNGNGNGQGNGNGNGNGDDPSPTSTGTSTSTSTSTSGTSNGNGTGNGNGNGNSSSSPSPTPTPTPTVTVSVTSTAGTTPDVKLVLLANVGPAVWRVAEAALLAGKPIEAPPWHAAGCGRHTDQLAHRDRSCHVWLDANAGPQWGASDRSGQGDHWWSAGD